MASRKKLEEKHLKILKELLSQPANKKCLECDQRGPTYVDVTIGSFVCTSCGGLLRGLNPPHRVKSISMTTFTAAEIAFIEGHGNEWCRAVYLAKYDEQSKAKPESRTDHSKLKHFLELKYEQKRWYESPSRQRKLMESVAAAAKKNREHSSPPVKPLNSLIGNVQIPSAKPEISRGISQKVNRPSTDLLSGGKIGGLVSPINNNASKLAQRSVNTSTAPASDGFADFDSAFGGGFPTTNAGTVPANQDVFAAFDQLSSQPISFTTNTNNQPTNSLQNTQPAGNNAVDKYAALADLDSVFGKVEPPQPAEKSNDFFWSSPAKPVQSNAGPIQQSIQQSTQQNVFGIASPPAQQNALFPAQQATNMHTTPASSSWMTTPTAVPAWASTSTSSGTNWNPYNSPYQQQQAVNPAPVASNPFFTPNAAQVGNDYGPWIQPKNHMSGAPSNQPAMSSTNPFAMGGSAQPANFMQPQQQIQRPVINNPSNPFMF